MIGEREEKKTAREGERERGEMGGGCVEERREAEEARLGEAKLKSGQILFFFF